MKLRPALLYLPGLALTLGLTSCQNQQAKQQDPTLTNLTALTERVTALETEVKALKAAQAKQSSSSEGAQADFEAQAAAQNCANQLARNLEIFRRDSGENQRYPTPAQLDLPASCGGQRLNWLKLEPNTYTFTITNPGGQELARQSAP